MSADFRPGASDDAIESLSDDELRELLALIRSKLDMRQPLARLQIRLVLTALRARRASSTAVGTARRTEEDLSRLVLAFVRAGSAPRGRREVRISEEILRDESDGYELVTWHDKARAEFVYGVRRRDGKPDEPEGVLPGARGSEVRALVPLGVIKDRPEVGRMGPAAHHFCSTCRRSQPCRDTDAHEEEFACGFPDCSGRMTVVPF